MTTQLTSRRRVIATAGVMLALLLAALDQTVVGTALPRIVAELKGLDYYSWVVTTYLVASTVVVPVAGKLGDLFGRKWFLVAGMVGFVLASALCGLSQTMVQLVIFRAIQGLFGGVLFAIVFTTLADLFPPERRARMQGLFGAVFGLSSIIGPTLGGYLTDNLSWRWVFYVNLPVGVLAVLAVMVGLPWVRTKASWRDIDFAGAVLLTAGMVPFLIALSITRDHAWTDPLVVGLLAAAVVFIGAFIVVELRVREPIVPFGLFKNGIFLVSVGIGFIVAMGMFGTVIYVPLLFQGVIGVSATNSGQLLTPMMLGVVVASTLTGQLMIRIPRYRFLGTVGMALMVGGMLLLTQIGVNSSSFDIVKAILIIGLGVGVSFPLYISTVQSALPPKVLGVATSQLTFWRNVGGTVGTAVFGSILSRQLPESIKSQINALHLPPQAAQLTAAFGSGSPQAIFDPAQLAAARAKVPPQFLPVFDQILHAVRLGLADTLHQVFFAAAVVVVLAVIASLFLDDSKPIRQMRRAAESEGEPVPVMSAG